MRTRIVPVLIAVSAAFLLAACSGATSEPSLGVSNDMVAPGSLAVTSEDGMVAPDGKVGGSATTQEQAVIKTAYVNLTVEDVGRTARDVHILVDKRNGLVSAEDSQVNGDANYSTITVQVPAAGLDSFIADVSGLGTVESVSLSTQDVTTQVVDLDARISALQTSIDRMTVLLAQAEQIDDLLAIETQLSSRQAELDSLTAQRTWLGGQVAMSSVTISLAPTTTLTDLDAAGFLSGLRSGWAAFVSALAIGVTAFGFLLPFALILVLIPLIAIAVRQSRRRVRPAAGEAQKESVGSEPTGS